jgi:hypothetical protein
LHPRQGRAYRDIFQILRQHLLQSLHANQESVYDPR